MRRRNVWALLIAVSAGIGSGNCGGEPAEQNPPPASQDSMALQELPPPPAPGEPQPVTLEAVNQSGVEGRAIAIPADDSVQFNLMVQGLPGAGEYAARINNGNCQSGGSVLVSLNPVRAESDGMGRSMTKLGARRLTREGSHFVQVRGPRGMLACGEVLLSGDP